MIFDRSRSLDNTETKGVFNMFCSECGAEISDKAMVCPKCGVPVAGKQVARNVEVKNHMVGAILQLVVCLPAGIIPLIYANKVNSRLAQGDVAGAQEASKKAKFWINLGTWVVGTVIVLWIVLGAMNGNGVE